MARPLLFADAEASFEEARFVIFGVPYDRTATFRAGARFAPNAIREASHNFEAWMFEHQFDIRDVAIHDAGNLEVHGPPSEMVDTVSEFAKEIVKAGKFPIALGGEHSISPGVVRQFGKIGVLTIDAHLDFRDEYGSEKHSHACANRRFADAVGVENVVVFGVRSIAPEEQGAGINYVDAYAIRDQGLDNALKQALNMIRPHDIYLSLDIDGIDPAYAPGTGTPEPFGLSPLEVKKVLGMAADRLVGFDVVEVCPPHDNGNTAALAARLVREMIAVVSKARPAAEAPTGPQKGRFFRFKPKGGSSGAAGGTPPRGPEPARRSEPPQRSE